MVTVMLVRVIKPSRARAIYFAFPQMIIPILILANVVLFFCRFVHSGRVCSGDYLDAKADASTGYLLSQGGFIKAYAVILSIGLYLLWCCVCFISARKTAANQKRREEQAR